MSANGLLFDTQISDAVQGAQALPSIPREAILDTVPRSALAATKKIVNLVPITSGSVGPNQVIQFLIPQRNLMKASSLYLKFRLSVTNATLAHDFSFAGYLQSAASLINNIMLQAGGVVLESLQRYDLWHNNILANAHQGNDMLAWEAVCSGSKLPSSGAGQWAAAAAYPVSAAPAVEPQNNYNQYYAGYSTSSGNAGSGGAFGPTVSNSQQFHTTSLDLVFTIPILAGVFNPKESQLIPLQFINGGILMTIQTNPTSRAFFQPAGSGISTYSMSEMELCYAEITPAPEYILRIREEMMSGKMIKIECQSYQQYNVASGSNVRQNFNVNLSSVSSIFWGRLFEVDALATSKKFQGFGVDTDQNTRYEVYLDNVLLFNSPNQLNCMAVQARQLMEAIQSTVTDYPAAPYTNGRGNNSTYQAAASGYPIYGLPGTSTVDNSMYTSNMLWGLSTKLFASNSTSMDGTPLGVLTINFNIGNSLGTTGTSEGNSNLWYIYVVYDYIYLVDATGSVSKNQ